MVTTAADTVALLKHALESRKSEKYICVALDVVTRLCEAKLNHGNSILFDTFPISCSDRYCS